MDRSGFTLVEVVVTSVIIALLATTATLLYGGYITDSAQQTVTDMAGVAASSANAYLRKTGAAPDSAKLNLFLSDASRYTVEVDSPNVIISDVKYSVNDTINFE